MFYVITCAWGGAMRCLSEAKRHFVPPRGDVLNRNRATMFDDHRIVEIIHRRADVPGNQIEELADRGHRAA